MQPIYGRLSDIFGRKVVLLASLVIFWIGSLACALAQVSRMSSATRVVICWLICTEYDPTDHLPGDTRYRWRWNPHTRDDNHLGRCFPQRERQIPGDHRSGGCVIKQYRSNYRWFVDGEGILEMVFRESHTPGPV